LSNWSFVHIVRPVKKERHGSAFIFLGCGIILHFSILRMLIVIFHVFRPQYVHQWTKFQTLSKYWCHQHFKFQLMNIRVSLRNCINFSISMWLGESFCWTFLDIVRLIFSTPTEILKGRGAMHISIEPMQVLSILHGLLYFFRSDTSTSNR